MYARRIYWDIVEVLPGGYPIGEPEVCEVHEKEATEVIGRLLDAYCHKPRPKGRG